MRGYTEYAIIIPENASKDAISSFQIDKSRDSFVIKLSVIIIYYRLYVYFYDILNIIFNYILYISLENGQRESEVVIHLFRRIIFVYTWLEICFLKNLK